MPSGSGSDPLLARADGSSMEEDDGIDVAAVDHRGRPAPRASTGRWRSALFIIAVEIAERFSFYGVSANLISYLTGPLGESNAKAASAINAWNGVAQLLPLLGAALADSCLGRYRTIVIASLLYILGLGMLALSTLLSSGDHKCINTDGGTPCPPPSGLQMAAFYTSLYLVALAQGGHKPCVQAFGADQFDASHPREAVSRSSFFNWWYFGICAGTAVTLVFLSYIQDNIGWGLGFGIPCVVMLCALAVFLLGTRTYRYYASDGKQRSLFARAGEAFAVWRSKRRKSSPLAASGSHEAHRPCSGRRGRAGGGDQKRGPHRGSQGRPPAVPDLGDVPDLRRGVLPVVHVLHEAGGDPRPARRQAGPGATGGAAELHQHHHRALHAHLRPRHRAAGAPLHGRLLGHHHAAAHRRRDGALARVDGGGGARGDTPAPDRGGRRPGGPAQGAGPDEPVVDGAAVRAVRRGGRVHHGGAAGVLLRPGARQAAQHRAGALPQHLRHRQLHQQRPRVGHRQVELGEGAELVLQQSQPRPPRLLLLAHRRAQRARACGVRLLRRNLQVQEEGSISYRWL
uniref:Peptide transporter PTR2 n=1 Tax=Aegilops tauschii subsp. strangulata TaxID=200361 RepID=A0A452Z6S3_AEGTS